MGYYSYGEGVGWYEEPVVPPAVMYSSIKRRDNMRKWLQVTWDATPATGDVVVEVRAGNSISPTDGTWIDWEEIAASGDYVSAAVNGRLYLQYRVTIVDSGVYLEWIVFDEIGYEGPVVPSEWGDDYSLYNSLNRAFWLIHPTLNKLNARWRGWRESEKHNQFMLDLTHDLAKLFYQYSQGTDRLSDSSQLGTPWTSTWMGIPLIIPIGGRREITSVFSNT
jgi:hypothetical protein